MNPRSSAAQLPPPGLPGLDPSWSRVVTATDADGVDRSWHVLDTGGSAPRGTVLCVHGNPNWSYMWRGLAGHLADYRVVAVDALNMGYSERIGTPRRLADHIADLGAVTAALEITGPVITVAHDWGGAISMGWAQQHVDQLAGIVLMNTGVGRPESAKVPSLISLARATLRATCETTPTFLHGALRMARPQLARDVYRGYTSPYSSPEMRTGIRDFVEDIPIEESHPTFETLASVATGLEKLQHVPALLLWGSKDIIFSDMFLHDLIERLPHADVHRYPQAGHQIMEDADAIDVIERWLTQSAPTQDTPTQDTPTQDTPAEETQTPDATTSRMWSAIEARAGDDTTAIIEMQAKDSSVIDRSISFNELDSRVQSVARGLIASGVKPGDRLATLVAPGIDLTVIIYACLRAGITVVAADAGLGVAGLTRALRSARPDYVVGDWRGLLLAKSLRLPATRFSVDRLSSSMARVSGASTSIEELLTSDGPAVPAPVRTDAALVVFTSGSTGPSKGVVYTHAQLEAQRDAIQAAFSVKRPDKIVVAFAPFAVLAPALGIPSVVPTMDVTSPAKLQAQALANAAGAIDATIVFASPAVLANIAATASQLGDKGRDRLQAIRLVATAGAPVSPALLADVQPVFPDAEIATPYGMTEVMPVTVASVDEIGAVESDPGVCVGQPLPTVEVAIRLIDAPPGTIPAALPAGSLGEVWVRAAHGSQHYDNLWARQEAGFVDGWHRSGDVGHLDDQGRLWIEGRVDHLIHGPNGVIAPVQIELQAESVARVDRAAAVGIGPKGTQQLAVVVVSESLGSGVVADVTLTAAVRAAVSHEVAAVLIAPKIPVDRRHNSKIDRTRVQKWAEAVLTGKSPRRV